jgi:integrase
MDFSTSQAHSPLTVLGARGLVTLPAASSLQLTWNVPLGANMRLLGPLLGIASCVLLPSDAARSKTSKRVLTAISRFLDWVGLSLSVLTGDLLIAYCVARCCPPVNVVLPTGWPPSPVLPSTVKCELGALRAAAKVGVCGLEQHLPALCDPRLIAFLKAVGANVGRLKSSKKPLLWSRLVDFVTPTVVRARAAVLAKRGFTSDLQLAVRDAFALVLGFTTGSRCRELLTLRGKDVQLLPLDLRSIVEVTFQQTKTRRTVLGTHDPFVTVVSHSLVVELWSLFDVIVGWDADHCVWVSQRGHSAEPLSRDWFAKLIKRVDPECTPHSMRVGLATELWAAGCDHEEIMTAGRWTSLAAVLYIIGSLDKALVAADAVGRGGLSYDGAVLRKRGIRSALPAPVPAEVSRWMRLVAGAA